MSEACVEFDCVECGTHVVVVGSTKFAAPKLCAHCLFTPGWFNDPKLRRLWDPQNKIVLPEISR